MNEEQLLVELTRQMLALPALCRAEIPGFKGGGRFVQMIHRHGGQTAAERLLTGGDPAYGFANLYLHGADKLKLSTEYLVLSGPWRELFAPEYLTIARERLESVNCPLSPDAAGWLGQ